MAKYVTLIRFTEAGAKNFQDTIKRKEDFRAKAQKAGVTVRDVYWTIGAVDGVLIFEAPDDETAAGLVRNLHESPDEDVRNRVRQLLGLIPNAIACA